MDNIEIKIKNLQRDIKFLSFIQNDNKKMFEDHPNKNIVINAIIYEITKIIDSLKENNLKNII